MPQLPSQRELLAVPHGATHLVANMSWELPEPLQPDPWVYAYAASPRDRDRRNAIDGQHAHNSYRMTRGGVIVLERNGAPTTATINLAALNAHCPDTEGVSFIANLYFGPQSHVKFTTLVKASIELAVVQDGRGHSIARHDVDLATAKLDAFQLPLASIMRERGGWSLLPNWAPRHYAH